MGVFTRIDDESPQMALQRRAGVFGESGIASGVDVLKKKDKKKKKKKEPPAEPEPEVGFCWTEDARCDGYTVTRTCCLTDEPPGFVCNFPCSDNPDDPGENGLVELFQ